MRIGYLGVGKMGQLMASRLIDAGHEIWKGCHGIRDQAEHSALAPVQYQLELSCTDLPDV
jgi:3-hydroxyisobutyrate dehydrogenase-like beta-hydroxyacid dehydrogenase